MIYLLTSPSCTSCRKTKDWLNHYQLPFLERNIDKEILSINELKFLLSLTENGIDDLLSTRSKVYQSLDLDFYELSFNQLLVLFVQYPQLVKRPIIYNEQQLQIGFNDEDIRVFLPKEIRQATRNVLYERNSTILHKDFLIYPHGKNE